MINLPITKLLQFSSYNLIPPQNAFPCMFYPFCEGIFETFLDCINHSYLEEDHEPQEINQLKRFLPHELTLYISIYQKFGFQIPNIINDLIPFSFYTHEEGFVIRKCPLPNCNNFIKNPDDFRQHYADHINHSNILNQSFAINGYIWSTIISHVKLKNKIPTVREFLGIPETNLLIPRNIINNNPNIPILILLRNIDYNFDNAPPWLGLLNRNIGINIPGLPLRCIDGGLIIDNIDLNNVDNILQIPLNEDIRVKEITDNEELINIEVSNTTPIIEEISDELLIRNDKIFELRNRLLSFILQIIENNFKNNINNYEQIETPNQEIKIKVPNISIEHETIPIKIPETKISLFNQEISIPAYNMTPIPIQIEVPNCQLIPNNIEYPIDIPNYTRNLTDFEIGIPNYHKYDVPIETPEFKIIKSNIDVPIETPNFKFKPKNILIPINKPDYKLIKNKIEVPIDIPKFDFYENRIKMDIDVMKYDFRDVSIPINIPKPEFNFIPKSIDIEIPIPNFRLNNENQQELQNNQLTSEGNNQNINNNNTNNIQIPNINNNNINNLTNSQNPNNNNNNENNHNNRELLHKPEDLIEELRNVNSENDLKEIINKWTSYNINNITDWIDNNKPLEDHYITNLIVIKRKWPGVNTFVCPFACGFATHSNTILDNHQKEVHRKVL